MFIFYVLILALLIFIFGMIILSFSYFMHIDRSQRIGKYFVLFGMVVGIIASIILVKEQDTRSITKRQQEKIKKEQLFDAQLVHLSSSQISIKNGKAIVTVDLSRNTHLVVQNKQGFVDNIEYKTKGSSEKIILTFVVAGEYQISAQRGENKVTKSLKVSVSNEVTSESVSSYIPQQSDSEYISSTQAMATANSSVPNTATAISSTSSIVTPTTSGTYDESSQSADTDSVIVERNIASNDN